MSRNVWKKKKEKEKGKKKKKKKKEKKREYKSEDGLMNKAAADLNIIPPP